MKNGKTVLLYQCCREERDVLYEWNPEIRLLEFQSQEDVLNCVKEENVDVIIVHLDRKNMSSICLIRRIRRIRGCEVIPVVFLESRDPFFMKAENRNIPFSIFLEGGFGTEEGRKFLEVLIGAKRNREQKIKIANGSRYFHFYQEDFVYVETVSRTLLIHTKHGKIEFPYYPLKEFLKKMNFNQVCQCHRSIAVNKSYILGIDLTKEIILLEEPYGTLDIGRNYKKIFLDKFLKES